MSNFHKKSTPLSKGRVIGGLLGLFGLILLIVVISSWESVGGGEDAGQFILELGSVNTSFDLIEDKTSDAERATRNLTEEWVNLKVQIAAGEGSVGKFATSTTNAFVKILKGIGNIGKELSDKVEEGFQGSTDDVFIKKLDEFKRTAKIALDNEQDENRKRFAKGLDTQEEFLKKQKQSIINSAKSINEEVDKLDKQDIARFESTRDLIIAGLKETETVLGVRVAALDKTEEIETERLWAAEGIKAVEARSKAVKKYTTEVVANVKIRRNAELSEEELRKEVLKGTIGAEEELQRRLDKSNKEKASSNKLSADQQDKNDERNAERLKNRQEEILLSIKQEKRLTELINEEKGKRVVVDDKGTTRSVDDDEASTIAKLRQEQEESLLAFKENTEEYKTVNDSFEQKITETHEKYSEKRIAQTEKETAE